MHKTATIHLEQPARPSGGPERWWQWFLVYPAVGMAAITALPQWAGQAVETLQGKSQQEAVENAMWRRNLSCAAASMPSYRDSSSVQVDAKVCQTGDVFIRAVPPGGPPVYRWLALRDVLSPTQDAPGLFPAAYAAPAGMSFRAGGTARWLQRVQYEQIVVLCQKFLDDRRLLRHVRAPDGCFDEIVDTFNGTVLERRKVPCRGGC